MQFVHNDSFSIAQPKNVRPRAARPKVAQARRIYFAKLFGVASLLALGCAFIQLDPLGLIVPAEKLPLLLGYAIVCLVAGLAALYFFTRHYLSGSHVWFDHCPCCESSSLLRARRTRTDHMLGMLFRLPLYRYGCTECEWVGNRIDHGRL